MTREAMYRRAIQVLAVMLVASFLLAIASAVTAAQPLPPAEAPGRLRVVVRFEPPPEPDATPQPASPEAPPRVHLLAAFSPPAAPPQPLTSCWDYLNSVWCDCVTHQRWEYWCHRCCNHPDYCPTGCCDIYCWWEEAGTCSCG